MGHGQLADPLRRPRDRAVRPAEGLVPGRARSPTESRPGGRERDELPSWATPTVFYRGRRQRRARDHAPNFIRGYDPRPARNSGASAAARTSPRRRPSSTRPDRGRERPPPNAPIFVMKRGRAGDITCRKARRARRRVDEGAARAPTCRRRSSTAATCTCSEPGILACYDLARRAALRAAARRRDERLQRLAGRRRRQALPAERGRRRVRGERGPELRAPRRNPMGQPLMATPAISDGCCSCAASAISSRSGSAARPGRRWHLLFRVRTTLAKISVSIDEHSAVALAAAEAGPARAKSQAECSCRGSAALHVRDIKEQRRRGASGGVGNPMPEV